MVPEVPLELQVAEVAPPPKVPMDRSKVCVAHIVWSAPASTVAASCIVIVTVSIAALHTPEGLLEVKVSVTVPAEISVLLGV
jgi:hypothetical protein